MRVRSPGEEPGSPLAPSGEGLELLWILPVQPLKLVAPRSGRLLGDSQGRGHRVLGARGSLSLLGSHLHAPLPPPEPEASPQAGDAEAGWMLLSAIK